MTTIRVSLAAEAAQLRSVLIPMLSIEAGLGADGVGHGVLRPPSEQLLIQDGINPADPPVATRSEQQPEPGQQQGAQQA